MCKDTINGAKIQQPTSNSFVKVSTHGFLPFPATMSCLWSGLWCHIVLGLLPLESESTKKTTVQSTQLNTKFYAVSNLIVHAE
mmetsp:Transcript_88664/g.255789  ORF Transcript_88664/g.255789 Transcript_88664/m.255789 type:complete len:83 (-) Transcript_88664:488-736(-)